jgi:hypothetical protein
MGIRTPASSCGNVALPAGSVRPVPFCSRSLPAVSFSGLDGVKTVDGLLVVQNRFSPHFMEVWKAGHRTLHILSVWHGRISLLVSLAIRCRSLIETAGEHGSFGSDRQQFLWP